MSVVITTYTLASGLMSQGMNWWQAMVDDPARQRDRADSDDSERARRNEVRHFVSRAVPRELRRAGRERAGDAARDRRVRLVRHSDVDRRARARRAASRGVAGMGGGSGSNVDRVRDLLGIQVVIILKGTEGIKNLESWSAPLLLGGGLLLLWWAIRNGGGLSNVLAQSQRLQGRTGRRSGRSFPPRSPRTSATGRRSASTSPTSRATRRASGRRCSVRRWACRRR